MTSLPGLLRDFRKETVLLRLLFEGQAAFFGGIGLWTNPRPTAIQSYAVVRLQDCWARFCRNLVLLSARGRVRTAGGATLLRSPLVHRNQSPLDALKMTYSRRRQRWVFWEPKWFDSGQAIRAAQQLRIANFAAVSAGLGLAGHGIDELRACRNFLAHRNQLSDDELDPLRNRLRVPMSTPAEQLANTVVPGGISLFDEWCAELLQRAAAAVQ